MRLVKYSALIVLLVLTLAGCTRENIRASDCDNLKKGLMAEDIKMVDKALKHELNFYCRINLIKLALTIAVKM